MMFVGLRGVIYHKSDWYLHNLEVASSVSVILNVDSIRIPTFTVLTSIGSDRPSIKTAQVVRSAFCRRTTAEAVVATNEDQHQIALHLLQECPELRAESLGHFIVATTIRIATMAIRRNQNVMVVLAILNSGHYHKSKQLVLLGCLSFTIRTTNGIGNPSQLPTPTTEPNQGSTIPATQAARLAMPLIAIPYHILL